MLRHADDAVSCLVAGTLVLMSLSAPDGDLDASVCVLNDTGARIWELIDGTTTLSDAIVALSKRYSVDAETIRDDVMEVVDDLVSKGYLGEDPAGQTR